MKTPKQTKASISGWLLSRSPAAQWAILISLSAFRILLMEVARKEERRRIAEEVANLIAGNPKSASPEIRVNINADNINADNIKDALRQSRLMSSRSEGRR